MAIKLNRDILPISEFKAQASSLIRDVRESNRSIVITQNGEPAAVLISPEEYDFLQDERARYLEKIDSGLADSQSGRVLEDDELTRRLETRHKGSRKRKASA